MKLPAFALSNFRFTIVVITLMAFYGLYSFVTMPRYEDPQIPSTGIRMVIIYPGASAFEVEEKAINPIEEVLKEIPGLKNIVATATNDVGTIFIEYEYGIRRDDKFSEVDGEIDNIRSKLPAEIQELKVEPIKISEVNIYQFALSSDSASYVELEEAAEDLKQHLKTVSGLGKIEILGIPERQVCISLDLEKLAGLQIPLSRVLGAIQSSNTFIPGGNLDLGPKSFNVYTNSRFETLSDVKRTIINSANGKVVYLENVADVAYEYEESNYTTRHNGVKCLFVTAEQIPSSNIVDIAAEVKPVLEKYENGLAKNIEFVSVYDQNEWVKERVSGFFINLGQGILLVGVIIVLLIGFRPSLVVMLAVPVSLVIGLGIANQFNLGLQQISIVGLVVALGLLVDNAIVVVENVTRYIDQGMTRSKAAMKGTLQIAWPVVSSTLTTVLAFAPLANIKDPSGDFIKSLPLTVIFTLGASLLVALTLTPVLSKRLLSRKKTKKNWIQRALDRFILKRYLPLLNGALARPYVTLLIALGMLGLSMFLFTKVPRGFFPKADKPYFMVNINTPEGSNLARTDSVTRLVEGTLGEQDFIEQYTSNIGYGNPRIYYNIYPTQRSANSSQILVRVKEESRADITDLIEGLRDQFSNVVGAKIELLEFVQGPVFEAPIVVRLIGENLKQLKALSSDIEGIIAQTDGTRDVGNPFRITKSDLEVHINKDKASIMGITLDEINRAIRTGISGVPISTFNDAKGKAYDIVVKLGNQDQFTLEDFDKIYVSSVNNVMIPLKQVADIRFRSAPSQIQHWDMQRIVTLTAQIGPNDNLNNVSADLVEKLDSYDWPQGYTYKVAGVQNEQNKTFARVAFAALVAFIAIFGVLVLQFNSLIQPLIIFTAIPLAAIGSIIALLITGHEFSFTAFVGLTSLIGIVVNDSILLVDFANQARKEGVALLEAIRQACEVRFIPIILTTLTTIFGLIPLTLIGGTLWAPMGWTIIGGLLTSTLLILIVVPVLYRLVGGTSLMKD